MEFRHLRAVENFPVSGRTERTELINAYVTVKKAAAIQIWNLVPLTMKGEKQF